MTDLHESDVMRIRVGTIWRARGRRRWRPFRVVATDQRAGTRVYVIDRIPPNPGEPTALMTPSTLERYYDYARRAGQRRLGWWEDHESGVRLVRALGFEPTDFGL